MCGGDAKKLPQKLEDPGIFTVPCSIGSQFVGETYCDLGSSVNVLPSPMYKKFGLSEMKHTGMTLHLADKYVKVPCSLVEDVAVKVDKPMLPADFVVLDIEEDQMVPIILGRPFFVTSNAKIDVKREVLTIEDEDENVIFTMLKETDNSFKGEVIRRKKKSTTTNDPP